MQQQQLAAQASGWWILISGTGESLSGVRQGSEGGQMLHEIVIGSLFVFFLPSLLIVSFVAKQIKLITQISTE